MGHLFTKEIYMYNYRIQRAVAIKRYDLFANGVKIDHSPNKKDVQSTANSLVVQGYLQHSEAQKKVLRKQGLHV